MRSLLFGLAFASLAPAALADDRADCVQGIAMLRQELPKAPPSIRSKLERELRIAQREEGEGEFDECVEAIGAARKAMGR